MAERKIVAYNRKASHDYFLEDRFEAGLELQGTEIKSVRNGKVQLKVQKGWITLRISAL